MSSLRNFWRYAFYLPIILLRLTPRDLAQPIKSKRRRFCGGGTLFSKLITGHQKFFLTDGAKQNVWDRGEGRVVCVVGRVQRLAFFNR